ncbi:hypothetical protein Y032_0022g557 [Ancylostoma ceylanicum]|uniref:Uncharacterized protein n=1 Tax=Ancylostoma ceylanicum TaxID=53326 RepID=A0A016UYM2_9BILA|nr:hypothetical protein Y032_0022g557 [Ancylostoma ceylanicum]
MLKQIKIHVMRVRTCQSRWITAMKPCCSGAAERLRGGTSERSSTESGRSRVWCANFGVSCGSTAHHDTSWRSIAMLSAGALPAVLHTSCHVVHS